MAKFKLLSLSEKTKNILQKSLFLVLPIIALLGGIAFFNNYYKERILPGVRISNISVAGKTKIQALEVLQNNINTPEKIQLGAKNRRFDLSLKDVEYSDNLDTAVNSAFDQHRNSNSFVNFFSQINSLFESRGVKLEPSFNEEKISEYLQIVSTQLTVEPETPFASIVESKIEVNKGRSGEVIDTAKLSEILIDNLSSQNYSLVEIPLTEIDPALSDEESTAFRKRAEKLIGKSILLKHEFDNFPLDDKTLLKLIDARENFNNKNIDEHIESQLIPKVNREPQNAVFQFEDGKVVEFKPAKNGATINKTLLKTQISQTISVLENSNDSTLTLEIPIESSPPKITTEEVNNLGIKELLGRGTSKFKGSIPGRVFNIGLASSKINGVLVPPGEVFSFNNSVGDVSRLTGYKQAYIIKDGKTVLGDGGGLCQVSTTLFRAALNAGLPIIERRAHSYRVGYYEQDSGPGVDATVFSPTTDFKFQNDTPGYLLIQTIYDAEKVSLAFEIYGTSDGRVSSITKPVITSSSAPPEDLYVDDPTLPNGQIKQIEHKAWGAKVNFSYKVERNGETITEKTFYSNYRPWQAVYLRGTGTAI